MDPLAPGTKSGAIMRLKVVTVYSWQIKVADYCKGTYLDRNVTCPRGKDWIHPECLEFRYSKAYKRSIRAFSALGMLRTVCTPVLRFRPLQLVRQ